MLDGWYCRTMANQQSSGLSVGGTNEQNETEDEQHDGVVDVNSAGQNVGISGGGSSGGAGISGGRGGIGANSHIVGGGDSGSDEESQMHTVSNINPRIDYKAQYTDFKKKLKFLLYENEFFQDALRSSQRRLLKVTRDRSFLLDRLLQYEKPEASTSESDETESSDDDTRIEHVKRRKVDSSGAGGGGGSQGGSTKNSNQPKRKKAPTKKAILNQMIGNNPSILSDGHMTAEEVERHLQSRQTIMELVPERAPPTVPTEMFSNEPSLDSESNDQMIETSPSNIGDECLSVEY